jgi:hypothetical protein
MANGPVRLRRAAGLSAGGDRATQSAACASWPSTDAAAVDVDQQRRTADAAP